MLIDLIFLSNLNINMAPKVKNIYIWYTQRSTSAFFKIFLKNLGSVVVAHGLSCSAACEIFPGPGLEPVSPALAGGFLITVPPGKSSLFL